MIRTTDLDRALVDYFVAETTDGAPNGLLAPILDGTRARRPRRTWELVVRGGWPGPTTAPARLTGRRAPLLAGLGIAVTVIGVGVLASRPGPGPAATAPSSPIPSGSPPATPLATGIGFGLDGTWTAVKPTTLRFSEPSGSTEMTLILGRRTTVESAIRPVDWFTSDATATDSSVSLTARTPGTVSFTTRTGGSGPGLQVGGPSGSSPEPIDLAPCSAGATAEYSWNLSPDRNTMTLEAVFDPCAARSEILANRIWTRLTPLTGDGGRITTTVAPAFAVVVPSGHAYAVEHTNASWELRATDRSVAVRAWRDPQGMRGPCDARAGRIDLAPGAAAFIAFLRGRSTLTVTTPVQRTVGGHEATSFVVTDLGSGCDTGLSNTWQPFDEASGRVWQTDPRRPMHLTLVDVDGTTVLLEIDADDEATEQAILASLEFLP